jgi:hypothetical protein
MPLNVTLADVLPAELLARHREHILDFLAMEGITPNLHDLGATQVSDRQLKELLEELAEAG